MQDKSLSAALKLYLFSLYYSRDKKRTATSANLTLVNIDEEQRFECR